MRVVSLHPDVIVATSAIWQTNCTIVRGGEECFVIDSPILPAELEALPALLAQAGFVAAGAGAAQGDDPAGEAAQGDDPAGGAAQGDDPAGGRVAPPSGLLATHGDWDHLLGRLAFPGAALGCAESTAARLRAVPGEPQRALCAFDEEYYIERIGPLALGSLQVLPSPGRCAIGGHELELHPADGHTEDGTAIWIPWARVLVAGDYLSSIEVPCFGEGGGTLDAYRATLERLRPLVAGAEHVVPGHGPLLDAERALGLLEEDLAYLNALRDRGAGAELPAGRRTASQRKLHAANMARLAQP